MMMIISDEDYKNIQPNNDGFDVNDMEKDVKDTFLFLTSVYRYMLTKYLDKKLGLKKYDELLKNSNLKFTKISKDEMDFYQFFNSDDYIYLYLRNNVHIGNLTNDERTLFLNIIKKSNMHYNDEIEKIVEATFKKVIFEEINMNESALVNFGPISQKYMALNNALVIGLRYDEFNSNDLTDDEWENNHNLQLNYIEQIANNISISAWKKLRINCSVIKYDDFGVIRRKTNL